MKTKKQKRIDAEERQERYDGLEFIDKWALTKSRRGESARERTRLSNSTNPHLHPIGEKK